MGEINIFKDLEKKIVVITGGNGHLGSSMVKILNAYGAIAYVLSRSQEKFDENFKGKKNVFFIPTDVLNLESINKSITSIGEKESKIDVLINNVNNSPLNHPEKMTSEEWRQGMEGGVNQYFDCMKAAIPFLKKSSNGKIINISSMYGMVVPDLNIYEGREHVLNPPNYGTSKAAILHLTKYYAMYLAKYNINVNAISPGPFPREIYQKDKVFVERLKSKTKIGRIGQPEDIDGTILLLSSEASNYITGQNIAIDGGWTV